MDCMKFNNNNNNNKPVNIDIKQPLSSISEIPQVCHTYAWIASKPSNLWGCEMGANEHGLVIGSVALASKLRDLTDRTQRLLDVDINRLVLERARTANEGLQVACHLLSEYGQGGPMTPNDPVGESYDSAYIISDNDTSWLLESTEFYWAAREITEPWFNIANHMTITTDYTTIHPDVQKVCINKGLWTKSEDKFNWREAVGLINPVWETEHRKQGGEAIMNRLVNQSSDGQTNSGLLTINDVLTFVRDKEAKICRCIGQGAAATVSSMISLMSASKPSCHLFTTTPDPSLSMYKPFIITPDTDFIEDCVPETLGAVSCVPEGDDAHKLYALHRQYMILDKHGKQADIVGLMRQVEEQAITEYLDTLNHPSLPDGITQICRRYTNKELLMYS